MFSGSTPDGNRTVQEDRSREVTADLKGSVISRFGDGIENTFLFGGQGFMRQRQSAHSLLQPQSHVIKRTAAHRAEVTNP